MMAGGGGNARLNSEEKTEEFAVSSHQLVSAMNPRAPIRTVIDRKHERFSGPPYSDWHNDPELARLVNDRLAGGRD